MGCRCQLAIECVPWILECERQMYIGAKVYALGIQVWATGVALYT